MTGGLLTHEQNLPRNHFEMVKGLFCLVLKFKCVCYPVLKFERVFQIQRLHIKNVQYNCVTIYHAFSKNHHSVSYMTIVANCSVLPSQPDETIVVVRFNCYILSLFEIIICSNFSRYIVKNVIQRQYITRYIEKLCIKKPRVTYNLQWRE